MLSKEDKISKLKIKIFNQCDNETIKLFADMLKHTEQLESDNYEQNNIINSYIEREQKLINVLLELKKEFTEELKYNFTKKEARVQLNLVDILLEKIVKGEKQ